MATQRYPAVLHQGSTSQQLEVSHDAQSFTLHIEDKKHQWIYAQTTYRSGGVPRFEQGEAILIVADHAVIESIKKLNPQALDQMEQQAGSTFTAGDFLTGLKAVLIVMAGAAAFAAIIWFLRK